MRKNRFCLLLCCISLFSFMMEKVDRRFRAFLLHYSILVYFCVGGHVCEEAIWLVDQASGMRLIGGEGWGWLWGGGGGVMII